jgi:hypothetical protein
MKSHRDNVKDVIAEYFDKWLEGDTNIKEGVPDLTDAVFDALGITEDEQDLEDGYFLHHAGKRVITYKSLLELVGTHLEDTRDFVILPMNDEIRNAVCMEEAMHTVMKEVMKDKKQADGKTVGVEHTSIKKDGVDRSEF